MSDVTLTEAAAKELADLFMEEADRLFTYARALPGVDTSLADDIVQEAFQAAARGWERLRCLGRDQVRSWLYTVARNKAIDQWRRSERLMLAAEPPDSVSGPDPADAMISSVTLQHAWDEITRMPPMRSRVLFLRFREDWELGEIAELLGISTGTVRAHLRDGRKQLRAALGGLPWDDASSGETQELARAWRIPSHDTRVRFS